MIQKRHIRGCPRQKKRILVTGGSGFIGTNLVNELLLRSTYGVLSLDIKEPQKREHRRLFSQVDMLDGQTLRKVFGDFQPTDVVHLAARTDLNGKRLDDYRANTVGVENLVTTISSSLSVERTIFVSSKLVCASRYSSTGDEDYHPDTVYGQSKVMGEKIVRQSSLRCCWCIVRPTSIWGPWFGIPYKGFFLAIARGLYFHPGDINPPRSFGYVGNVVHQIVKLLETPKDTVHKRIFYLSDYERYTVRQWANNISLKLRGKEAGALPVFIFYVGALVGDLMKQLGISNPPLTSFRLANMQAAETTGIPLGPMKEISGNLPYSMDQGVDLTIQWLRGQKFIS